MSRYHPDWDISVLLAAAARWRDTCLVGDGSVFSDAPLWTQANVAAVRKAFVENAQEGDEDFFEKLRVQVGSAGGQTVQLMAEMLWLLLLIQSNIKPATKRDNIRLVWSWCGQQLPEDHPALSDDVLRGVANTGTAYNTQRWRELVHLIDIVTAFKQLAPEQRAALTADVWRFYEWLATVPQQGRRQFRHVLCYLCYPDTFERIFVISHKVDLIAKRDGLPQREVEKLSERQRDERLLAIRARIEHERGTGDYDFYRDTDNDPRRQDKVAESTPAPSVAPMHVQDPPRNVIYFGPPGTGKTWYLQQELIPRYLDSSSNVSSDELIEQGIQDLSWWEVIGMAMHDMKRHVRVDDVMAHPYFRAKARLQSNNNLRATCWSSLQMHTGPGNEHVHFSKRQEPHIFSRDKEGNWTLTPEWHESCADLITLHEKLGKGSTAAGVVARRYVFVTFHQSYSYEDFIEGIRPETTPDGSISYNVKQGAFRRICARAKADPQHRYAVFIDEINRGNVARIFGELITLVEADKRTVYDTEGNLTAGLEVQLPYSGEPFGVPRNLDIYGTMNTADRSTALLDTALRRRFQFHELMPMPVAITGSDGNGQIADGEGGSIDLRALLTALNQRMEALLHRDQTLGHAFFTPVKDFAGLKSVLLEKIIPQLQEYFYEDWSRIRLVLGDDSALEKSAQLVEEIRLSSAQVFGKVIDELQDVVRYKVKTADRITADAIRKIYEQAE
jgi:5-methylcytosine-specific restriction protein B